MCGNCHALGEVSRRLAECVWPLDGNGADISKESASRQRPLLPNMGKTSKLDVCSEGLPETCQSSPRGIMKSVTDVTRGCGFHGRNSRANQSRKLELYRASVSLVRLRLRIIASDYGPLVSGYQRSIKRTECRLLNSRCLFALVLC